MAAAIDDPNILPIYEAGEVDGVLFIAMRYVEGTDLAQRLRDGPLEPREAVHLLGPGRERPRCGPRPGPRPPRRQAGQPPHRRGRDDDRGDHAYLTDFGLTQARAAATPA